MSTNYHPRVVVTGMGVVSPLGNSVETMWQNLLTGTNVCRRISKFDPSGYAVQIGCEIDGFGENDYGEYVDKKEARRMDMFLLYSIAAAGQAFKQSGLKIDESNADDVGALIGTGIGGMITVENAIRTLVEKGPMRVSPFTGPYMIPNMGSGEIAIIFGVRGPNFSLNSACATGSHAIGEAFEIIRRGDAVAMVTGGAEAPLCEFGLASFHRTQAMSTRNDDPKHASRPFDAQRDGFVFGEGAGVMIFEELEFAKKRGAKILGEMVGYGATDDAYHISAPAEGGLGAAKAMRRAIEKAGLKPEDVDYINAHGTSTVLNDKAETEAIKKVLGEKAYDVPISSSKSMLGHMLGAAGAVEAIVSIKTIETGQIHPTINYEFKDPNCDLDYVPNQTRRAKVRTALSNSFGFGGHNASVVFKKYEG